MPDQKTEEAPAYKSFRELIQAWPRGELAGDLGLATQVIRNWKGLSGGRPQNIPAAYWNAIVRSAQERDIEGVTVDLLSDLAEAGGHM